MLQYLSKVIDLTDSGSTRISNMGIEQARGLVQCGPPRAVRGIDGSFAIVTQEGKRVRMARSLDRPMRYFLAKKEDGPVLIVAHRIDAIHEWLKTEGLGDQFHPSYTRMVPAHYVVEIELVGCPDPDPTYTRFFLPKRNELPPDLNHIGRAYISALASEVDEWLQHIPAAEPIGVCFSGGVDSGAVFLLTYYLSRKLGMNLGRLKAFTLDLGEGPDLQQARTFLRALDLEFFLEPILMEPSELNIAETIRVVEDYKPLDIESAAMTLTLCKGIRTSYPDWRYLVDGDGGDENLKDYPIEENPELTIRSVIQNPMLYHEGWGVGKIKHSLTYSGGLSRSYARTYATARHCGFEGFSPFTRPDVIEVAEGIPFAELSGYDTSRLYELKGEIVSRGIKQITGIQMPVFPKRRFQHGTLKERTLRRHLPFREADYRQMFYSLYS